jgi:hypothetical protein
MMAYDLTARPTEIIFLGHRNQDRTDVKVQMFKINTETT